LTQTPAGRDIAMNPDPLSDVLRSVRLRGSVFYYVSFRDEWAAETPESPDLTAALMPGAEHVIAYHMVAKGNGWRPSKAWHRCACRKATSCSFRGRRPCDLQRARHSGIARPQ